MKRYWRLIKLSLVFAGFFFMLGFFYKYHLPRIERWLLVELETASAEHSPVQIVPQSLEVNLFPIGVTLKNVRILPQKRLAGYFTPTTVGEVNLDFNLFSLLAGQIQLSRIVISNAKFNIKVARRFVKLLVTPSTRFQVPFIRKPLETQINLDRIESWPVSSIQLQNVALTAQLQSPAVFISVGSIDLLAQSRYRSIRADFATHDLQIQTAAQKNGRSSIYQADLSADFLFDKGGIYFSKINVSRGHSSFTAAGAIEGNLLTEKIQRIHADIQSNLNMPDITQTLSDVFADREIPVLRGQTQLDGEFDYRPDLPLSRALQAKFKVQTLHLGFDDILVGDADIHGTVQHGKLLVRHSKIKNIYGQIDVPQVDLAFDQNEDFKIRAKSDRLDLQRLLRSLNLGQIPVYAQIDGDMPCTGHLRSPFVMTCNGVATGQNFYVNNYVRKSAQNIVRVDRIGVQAAVTLTPKGVAFKSNLTIGSANGSADGFTKGKADGYVSFQHGFKINFSTDQLNFHDVANLAGINAQGTFAVKGTTEGHLHTATVDLMANGNHAAFYNYKVGRPRFRMQYRAGKLFFDHLVGELNETRYSGQMTIDLEKSDINLNVELPFLDIADVTDALSNQYHLPIQASGTGEGSLHLSGPFDLHRLSYNLGVNLFRGSIAGESFDQLTFDVNSRDGLIQARNVNLVKGNGSLNVTGSITPTGQTNLQANGNGFAIEQLEIVSKLGLNVTGNMSLHASLSGPIADPTFDVHGNLMQTTVGNEPTADSHFHFMIDPTDIDAGGSFMGSTIAANLHTMRGTNGSTHAKFKIANWDFARALTAVSNSVHLGSYVTNLSTQGDLTIPNNDWREFSGRLNIDNFEVQNGQTGMQTTKPLVLTAQDGVIQAEDFEITGTDQTFIRLQSEASQPGHLALSLNGNVDMALMSVATPFLDDLRGREHFSMLLTGPVDQPHLSGAIDISNGLVKIKNFPPPLEQISCDITINKNQISINSLKSRLAGGLLVASGHISVNGPLNMPVAINGSFKDSRFDVPAGFKTRGSGDFYLKGNWFPYLLGVNYVINSGDIESLKVTTKGALPEIKPSIYLPKFLTANQFTPIALAVNIDIQNEIPLQMTVSRMDIQSHISGQLHISGVPQTPVFDGKITVARGGKVAFRDNTFDLSSATATYKNASPDNPVLDVHGTTKLMAYLKNSETREFDVDLSVQGPAKNPKIILQSTPALSQSDIVSLLTLGFISESPQDFTAQNQINAANPNSQIANTGAQFGSAFLSSSLGINKIFERKLGVKLDVSSSYDSIDQTTKPTITLRKQWNPRFGTTASREIGTVNVNDFSADYKLKHNVSVLGSWEGRQYSGADESPLDQENNNIFGLDLQYSKEFK